MRRKSKSLVPRASGSVNSIAWAPAMMKFFAAGAERSEEFEEIGLLWLGNHAAFQRGSIALVKR